MSQIKRKSYHESFENSSKEELQKEFNKLSKSYNYQSGNVNIYQRILSGDTTISGSNPEKNLKKHEKSMKDIENKIKILKDIACKKYKLCD